MKLIFENCNCTSSSPNAVSIVAPEFAGRYESDENVLLDVEWDAENHKLIKAYGKLILDVVKVSDD